MKNTSALEIFKMSGTGNTFALIDARLGSAFLKFEKGMKFSRPELTRRICDNVVGVHADGALFIQNGGSGFDFDWDFYNSDGSTAEMCGNAARCAARFCGEELLGGSGAIRFNTGAGLVTAKPQGDRRIEVIMPEAKFVKDPIDLKTHNDATESFALVNTGVPHLVQMIHNLADVGEMKEMAREVRLHKALMPAGANVTFYVEKSVGHIDAVTFERGVEDYTLACGTGAVAAALVYFKRSGEENVQVKMPGGPLDVQFLSGDPRPRMSGEAIFIGRFEYSLEGLK